PKEFFQKYGRYMLTLLEMIKYGVTIDGFTVPPLAAVSGSGTIDIFKNSLDTISQAAVNQSIEYLQEFATKNSEDQDSAKNDEANSFSGQDALGGANLRQLKAFIKDRVGPRVLGDLYRTVTQEGHVEWVCIDHYRLTYIEKDQLAFERAVEVIDGFYRSRLGQVAVRLRPGRASEFFDTLTKARHVYVLDITFGWGCATTDLEELEHALKNSRVSLLRLDLQYFRKGFGGELQSTSTPYEVLVRIIEHLNMKIIHIVIPSDLVEIVSLQPKRLSHLTKLSFEVQAKAAERYKLKILTKALRSNSALTILDLGDNSIGFNEAAALAKALKTNSTLTALNLSSNSIKANGAAALSEALQTNSTLTTLNLDHNSIGDNGAVALSEALRTNSTLTTLDLDRNSIRANGAVALSEALKTNSTLTTLNLAYSSIGDNGAALKTNSTLTTLNLDHNSIGNNGAVALSEALETNSTLITLNFH
ncbi:hypothetical protein BGZ51_009289, partial [Haplosporangium sp. Z 767]